MLHGLAAVLSASLTLFFASSYSGPYRFFAELQLSIGGSYFPLFAGLPCWAVCYAPLHLAASAIQRLRGVTSDPWAWARSPEPLRWVSSVHGGLATTGLVVVAVGAWFGGQAASAGELTAFSMRQAEAGEVPASRYVRLTDAVIDVEHGASFKSGAFTSYYFPVYAFTEQTDVAREATDEPTAPSEVTAPDVNAPEPTAPTDVSGSTAEPADRPARPIAAFVQLVGDDLTSPPEAIVGLLEADGLPGALRAPLVDEGLLTPAYFVIRHGQSPEGDLLFAQVFLAAGALLLGAGGVAAYLKSRARALGAPEAA
jgi:hypothetical protein